MQNFKPTLPLQRKMFSNGLSKISLDTKRTGVSTQVFYEGSLVCIANKSDLETFRGQFSEEFTKNFPDDNKYDKWVEFTRQKNVPSDLRVWFQDQAFKTIKKGGTFEFQKRKDLLDFVKFAVAFKSVCNSLR